MSRCIEYLPAEGGRPAVQVVRSTRRTRTVQALPLADGSVKLMVPAASSRKEVLGYLEKLLPKVAARQQQKDAGARRGASDDMLRERVAYLRAIFLPETPEVASIRWVTNQGKRWASATPSQGTIRVSHQLQGAPEYVLDFVIFHELCHLLEPNHSSAFRALEARYPHADRARAFLEGVNFGQRSSG